MTALRWKLGKPENRWVPVKLTCDDKFVEFLGSDVPNNPVQELVDALWKIAHGDMSEVWWHLEPDGYFFVFEPKQDKILFSVFFAENSTQNSRREILRVTGDLKSIVLPLWRGLREFLSYPLAEPHWPPINESEVTRLGTLIKNEGNSD